MKPSLALLLMIFSSPFTSAVPADETHLYSTWDTMELDKVASLWLIKRFIDPDAAFKFYPRGTMEMKGVQIDTPLSRFRRTQNATVFECLLREHRLTNASLVYLGRLVRDVEINIWGKKALPESQGVDAIVQGIILSGGDPQECASKEFLVFDALYRALEAKK